VDRAGRNAFRQWRRTLEIETRARVDESLYRVELGNLGGLKSVGHGVSELRLHFGPGYRIHCGRDGDAIVVLLGGGTKKRQEVDIQEAQLLWREYKLRKKEA
jgi:putative addiction module killer protein